MAKLTFSAQVAAFAEKVPGAVEAVFRESVQEVSEEMLKPVGQGGRMRVDTGFLRASAMASTTAMPRIIAGSGPVDGKAYPFDFAQIEAVIAGADITDTIYVGFTAGYAAHREFGANGQPPDAFVRSAAQQWQTIVNRKAADLKRRLGL
ncbi:HK97 gp10 family phage protein [Neorhizobium sp. CSC1952]|uniref:HK97 gp10 family phage protein n=1 Tax=Neorhizobium sp. CSC1952 TaxID=2978974 RepID=UPI0025A51575|nr:HK97 gp10 family phage protein [Rhizobium sp. CSC1952]WJR66952.1 HK97 gp10 family phage protein [Rhizobium sp. CSC1952]